jgi:hypothetical protein
MHPIIVIGPERSGTSVIAQMVHRWGAYAGEPANIRGADLRNETGYWEYLPVWDFLASMGVDWWEEDFQQCVKEKAAMPRYREGGMRLIAEMESAHTHWVWKDPALSFFLPFWQQLWTSPVYVVAVRNPRDAALSWQKFILPPEAPHAVDLLAHNLMRWHYIMSLIMANTEHATERLFFSYDALMAAPLEESRRLCGFLDHSCSAATSGPATVDRMAETVRASLWHERSHVPFDEVDQASLELKELYRLVLRKAVDAHAPFVEDEYPMRPGWRDIVKHGEASAAHCREQGREGGPRQADSATQ